MDDGLVLKVDVWFVESFLGCEVGWRKNKKRRGWEMGDEKWEVGFKIGSM